MHTAFTEDSPVKAGHVRITPMVSVTVSAESGEIRQRMETLAGSAGVRIVTDGEKYDILLLSVNSSTPSQLLRDVARSGRVCAIWGPGKPSRNGVLRMLRAGMAGVLSLESTPEQLKSAVDAMRANLQVIDPQYSQPEAPAAAETIVVLSEELTDREQQVLGMMADGLANKEIAVRLNISAHTVKFHISSILGKLGASSRTEAVSIGVRSGRVLI